MSEDQIMIDDGYAILDEVDHEEQEAEKPTALITVTSLPEIQENLRALRERWEQKAADAAAMVCTEETVQAIKKMRADMRKEYEEADRQRKMDIRLVSKLCKILDISIDEIISKEGT